MSDRICSAARSPRVVSSERFGSGGCGGSKAVGLPCARRPAGACGHRHGPLTHRMPRAFLESCAGADMKRGPKQQLPAFCPSLPGGRLSHSPPFELSGGVCALRREDVSRQLTRK